MQTTFVGSSNTCPRGWDFNSYDKHFIDNLADYMPYPKRFFLIVVTLHSNTVETTE